MINKQHHFFLQLILITWYQSHGRFEVGFRSVFFSANPSSGRVHFRPPHLHHRKLRNLPQPSVATAGKFSDKLFQQPPQLWPTTPPLGAPSPNLPPGRNPNTRLHVIILSPTTTTMPQRMDGSSATGFHLRCCQPLISPFNNLYLTF